MGNCTPIRVNAALKSPLSDAVVQLRERGYTDSELIRRGIRLVAKEEGISLGKIA